MQGVFGWSLSGDLRRGRVSMIRLVASVRSHRHIAWGHRIRCRCAPDPKCRFPRDSGVGTRPIRRLCRFASAQRSRVRLPLETASRVPQQRLAARAPEESRCERRSRCDPFVVRAVRTIGDPAALFRGAADAHLAPALCRCRVAGGELSGTLGALMHTSHQRFAVAGGSVRGPSGGWSGAFRRLLSIGDMISARRVYVHIVLQSVTPPGKPSRRENGVVSDRRKGVAHRVPNSLTKNMTTVRVYSHTCLCKIPVAIDVLRHDH